METTEKLRPVGTKLSDEERIERIKARMSYIEKIIESLSFEWQVCDNMIRVLEAEKESK